MNIIRDEAVLGRRGDFAAGNCPFHRSHDEAIRVHFIFGGEVPGFIMSGQAIL